MNRRLRVGWFLPVSHRNYDRMSASVWIRCLQMLPWLEQCGIQSYVNDTNSDIDIAVFVRMQGAEAFALANAQKQRGRKVVFDLVVNYFDEADVPGLGRQVTAKHVAECERMVSVADAVTCASTYITGKAAERHNNAVYLPDSIDPKHFALCKPQQEFLRPRLRAIWSGYSVKAYELSPLLPTLRELGIDLIIISEKPPKLKVSGRFFSRRFPYEFIPWKYHSFPNSIIQGDICLGSRSLNTSYNMGHSIFKIGVFMSQGVPAIASPVPSYGELLGAGTGGQLCQTGDDWKDVLARIVSDRKVLTVWSGEARENARKFHCPEVATQYARLFSNLCENS